MTSELAAGGHVPLPAGVVLLRVTGPFDVSGLVGGADGKVGSDADFVFYNQPRAPGVRLRDDGLDVDPARLRGGACRVTVVVSAAEPGTPLGRLPAPRLQVTDGSGRTVARFTPPRPGPETVLLLAELYLRPGTGWKLRAIGQGYADGLAGLARDFGVDITDDGSQPPPTTGTPPTAMGSRTKTGQLQDGPMAPPPHQLANGSTTPPSGRPTRGAAGPTTTKPTGGPAGPTSRRLADRAAGPTPTPPTQSPADRTTRRPTDRAAGPTATPPTHSPAAPPPRRPTNDSTSPPSGRPTDGTAGPTPRRLADRAAGPMPTPPTQSPAGPPPRRPTDAVTGEFLRLVNSARAQAGSVAVGDDPRLGSAAWAHAQAMADAGRLAAEGRDGVSVHQRITAAGYAYATVGEHLVSGPRSPAEFVEYCLGSDRSRRTLLDPAFRHAALAHAEAGDRYWTALWAAPLTPDALSRSAAEVVALTNAERGRAGLPPLATDPLLTAAAQAHCADMVARDFYDHTSPDGSRPWDRAAAAGSRLRTIGENIACGQRSPAEVVDGWMNSPGHRANILKREFGHIGVGFAGGGRAGTYWTQLFGG
ncbi:CAP domain-containing protein [Streptomyces sp. NPDC001250]|uniref:CAP domain-containing protein n=1 Tax=unclassified Streptomyces TaxID=2593676 RepID=UPI00331BE83D